MQDFILVVLIPVLIAVGSEASYSQSAETPIVNHIAEDGELQISDPVIIPDSIFCDVEPMRLDPGNRINL